MLLFLQRSKTKLSYSLLSRNFNQLNNNNLKEKNILWNQIKNNEYNKIITYFDSLSDEEKNKQIEVYYTTILAYSGNFEYKKARKLSKLLKEKHPLLDEKIIPTLLITTYSYSNKLDSTESILMKWLTTVSQTTYPQISQLITELDGNRKLNYELSSKDENICEFSKEIAPPGYRVWHSLLHIYNIRGAWKQSLAILRYLQSLELTESTNNIYANNFVYHYVISTLCNSTNINSYSYALDFYQEMKTRNITPHPLTLSSIIKSLSSWSRDGVSYIDTMMHISNLICSTCIDLSKISDEEFIELYAKDFNESKFITSDPCSFPLFNSNERLNRLTSINKLITQLMISLSCHRGLTLYAHGLMDHLKSHDVYIPNEAIKALIQGYSQANRWKDGLKLYNELLLRGEELYGSHSYYYIAESMIRTDSKKDLNEFITPKNYFF